MFHLDGGPQSPREIEDLTREIDRTGRGRGCLDEMARDLHYRG